MYKKVGKLNVGDAFEHEGSIYITFSLTPDPFEVYCLNVETKKLEEIYEDDLVKLIKGWNLVEDLTMPRSGVELEVL